MKEFRDPYLAVQDPRIMMRMPNAVRSTVFGALGRVHDSPKGYKSLGGLVDDTKTKAKHKDDVMSEKMAEHCGNTEKKILGPKGKTSIPGVHMGMVPYPGLFMKMIGHRL